MIANRSLEEEYYEYDGFWNPSVTPLGDIDHRRIDAIYKMLPTDTQSILDVGCGNGIFCNFVAKQRPSTRVVGFDRSITALEYVQSEKKQGDITALPFQDYEFDCATVLEVLEHLPIPAFITAKKEIARVAKKQIIVSVPNSQLLGTVMTQCPSCKSIFDPDLHVRSFNRETLGELFKEDGFLCQSIHTLGESKNYWGVSYYSRLLRYLNREPEFMRSPICPICGYTNSDFLKSKPSETHTTSSSSVLNIVKQGLKSVWPEIVSFRWLVATYSRP